jgi:hypothetical protein
MSTVATTPRSVRPTHKDDRLVIVVEGEGDTVYTVVYATSADLHEWVILDVKRFDVNDWVYHDPVDFAVAYGNVEYGTVTDTQGRIVADDLLNWQDPVSCEDGDTLFWALRDGAEYKQVKQQAKENI